MKKLTSIAILLFLFSQVNLLSQSNPPNQTTNEGNSGNVNWASSYKDVKITKISRPDSLNANSKVFYVTLNKGLNWQIKPNN